MTSDNIQVLRKRNTPHPKLSDLPIADTGTTILFIHYLLHQ